MSTGDNRQIFHSTLIARNAAIARAGQTIVSGIDLTFEPGSVTLVRGQNGAGKTTLLKALGGSLPLSEGQFSLTVPEQEEPNLTDASVFIGHLNGLKPSLTVCETIAFWARLYRRNGQHDQTLNRLNIKGLEHRRITALSAGQKRRVALSRLLIANRSIWLLDEPTASLDQESIEIVESLIKEHAERGGISIIASHDSINIPGAKSILIAGASS